MYIPPKYAKDSRIFMFNYGLTLYFHYTSYGSSTIVTDELRLKRVWKDVLIREFTAKMVHLNHSSI